MNALHRWYCRSDHWAREVRSRTLPWVLDGVDLGEDVLEIGPGPGRVTDVLQTLVPRLTSLELDPSLARALRSRFDGLGVDVREGDARSMDFPDHRFSGAVSMTMLHHVPSPAAQNELLAEVHRVLRPGAVFVGCDSRTSPLFRLAHVNDTLVAIDPDTFGARLEAAGFGAVCVEKARRAFRFRAIA